MRSRTRALGLGLLALLLLGLSGLPRHFGGPFPWAVELCALLLALPFLLGVLQGPAAGASQARLWRAVSVILALTALGHTLRDKRSYPLMPFSMYGRARQGAITYYEYRVRRRSGDEHLWKLSSVIETLEYGRIVKGMKHRLDALSDASGAARQHERALVERTLRVLARVDNRDEQDPLVSLDIYRVVIAPPYTSSAPRRKLALHLPLEAP